MSKKVGNMSTSKKKSIGIWVAIIFLALPMAAAGTAKLMGVEMLHMSFKVMGLPEWTGYFIGLCEVCGSVGLLIRRISSAAASGLLIIMLGALSFHIIYTPLAEGVAAMVFAVLAIVIMRARKKDSIWFSGQTA